MAQGPLLEMTADANATTYVTLDFLLWQQQGSLVLSPKFQRRPIWKSPAKGYFIDTLLRGFPVPPLHLRLEEIDRTRVNREVIDGQQRLRALFEFFDGDVQLPRSVDSPWSGKTHDQLTSEEQARLNMYKFPVFQYQHISDPVVLEIFARINTYSVSLNSQELRNGKWFGDFKQTVYSLALEYLDYWRQLGIFTEGGIARMREAELVGELLVLELDGIQDKKASLNSFYEHLDKSWGAKQRTWEIRGRTAPSDWLSQSVAADRLKRVLDEIGTVAASVTGLAEFRRVPLFYSLFGALYHRLYGLPRVTLPTPRTRMTKTARSRLSDALNELSELLNDKAPPDDFVGWRRDFLVASARQTDNVGPRSKRLEILWKQAGLAR
jgi:Protein of unknown function DUF262